MLPKARCWTSSLRKLRDSMHNEPFTLETNYRPKRRKVKGENNPNTRQTVLFAGMNLLPGQTDLFATDGKEPTPKRGCTLCGEPVSRPDVTDCGEFHPACAENHAARCESCRQHFPL